MSGSPSCATTEPSRNSTSEWTIDCGWMTTSMRSASMPKSHFASMTSSALFMSVAESIVIFAPMRHVGCLSACSTEADAITAFSAVRNGPPDPVMMTRSISSRRPASIAWKSALCSLSTGTMAAFPARAASIISGPAQTSDSLFASASVFPARSAASPAGSPAAPRIALSTTSTSSAVATSQSAFSPRSTFTDPLSDAARRPAPSVSTTATRVGLNSFAWSRSVSQLRRAASPTTRQPLPRWRATSRALRPMDPVEPRTAIRFRRAPRTTASSVRARGSWCRPGP